MLFPLHRLHCELRQRLFVHCRGKASLPLRPASPALDLERGILLQASDLADQSTGGSVDVGVKGKPVVIRAGVEIDYYPVLAPDHSSGKINPGPTGQYLHPSAPCYCLPLARDGLCYGKAADGPAGKHDIEIRQARPLLDAPLDITPEQTTVE